MNLSLEGRQALVCGGSQGIGLAVARELSEMGAQCMLLARNEDRLRNAVGSLDTKKGQKHSYKIVDFDVPEQVKKTIGEIVSSYTLHILINNSGGPAAGPIVDALDEQFLQAFNQHLINNHNLVRAVLPGMKEAGFGRVINIISTSVKIPLRNLGVSNTIRGAVASWAKTMANEVGQFGVTVNNVLPGFTTTERLSAIVDASAKKANLSTEVIERNMIEEVPAKRFGSPEEIAALAAFLASPAASYINGTSIPVDGGRTGSI